MIFSMIFTHFSTIFSVSIFKWRFLWAIIQKTFNFFHHCRIFPKFPLKGRRLFTIALSSKEQEFGHTSNIEKRRFFLRIKIANLVFVFVKRQKNSLMQAEKIFIYTSTLVSQYPRWITWFQKRSNRLNSLKI